MGTPRPTYMEKEVIIDQCLSDQFAIYNGDCMDVMAAMPTGSVHHSIY